MVYVTKYQGEHCICSESSHYFFFLLADVQQETAEHDQIANIVSYSQRGRMDEQRCSLSPVKTGQNKTTPVG